MFSRYKKNGAATPVQATEQGAPKPKQAAPEAALPDTPASLRKPVVRVAADPVAADKERKRKERMGEIKI